MSTWPEPFLSAVLQELLAASLRETTDCSLLALEGVMPKVQQALRSSLVCKAFYSEWRQLQLQDLQEAHLAYHDE